MVFLPPATKLGQGNIFRTVCQEFHGGRVSRPTPRWGRLGGLAGGGPRPTPGGFQAQARGILTCTEADPPQTDGYCCGRNASYWNAFLFQDVIKSQTNESGGQESIPVGFIPEIWIDRYARVCYPGGLCIRGKSAPGGCLQNGGCLQIWG